MDKEELKALRVKLGLTQKEFGDKLGLKRSAIAKLESGKNGLRGSTLKLVEQLETQSGNQ